MSTQTQSLTYEQRSELHSCQVAKKLLEVVCRKKSNLCASLDVRTTAEMLALAEKVGPYVSLVKTHIDIIDDFDYDTTIGGLTALAKKYDFLIFEDRKFADIGSTVKQQYAGGVYKIAQWSDFTNAHGVPGPGIVTGLSQAAAETTSEPRGLLMLAELSSAGSLAVGDYTAATIGIAQQFPEFVFGFIAQNRPKPDGMDWLVMTPGVGLDDKGDNMGQQYRTVEDAVSKGSDIIIVGRGLFGKGRDPAKEAERYRAAGWDAYIQRLSN